MRYNPPETIVLRVDRHYDGWRLDRYVTTVLHWRSRTSMQEGISDGQITHNGRKAKPANRVRRGDTVEIAPRPDLLPPFDPSSVPVDVLFEDPYLAVFNKPPHIVVHPTCSHLSDHFLAVLQLWFKGEQGPDGPVAPRLAHRIDGNTSGVLLVTKQESVRAELAGQFAKRTVKKEYHALVEGVPDREAWEATGPIGLAPDAERTTKRAVRHDGLHALTHFRMLERFDGGALVSASPHTGRTHQIRVHLAHGGFPILCDTLYGAAPHYPPGEDRTLLARHALHAHRLTFRHPVEGRDITVEAPYPEDMAAALSHLRKGDG